MFEPIEIDFGYEDAVAFDSDKGIFQGLPRSKLSRIPTVKLKIPGKSRIQKFCYIHVIVFDLRWIFFKLTDSIVFFSENW